MRQMTTLGEVFDRVDELSRNCTDKLIPVEHVSFDHLESVRIGGESHLVRPIAQRSIAYRLGIPIQYLRRCPSEIQAYNMNYWIEKERNEELFFRFDGEEVRAVFTPKYKAVDNFEVLERLDSLGYGPDTRVQCHLDAEFMSVNIPDRTKTFSIGAEEMTPGISISNSEVGLASLSIAAFVLRLVCTNGLISKTQVDASYRHVSRKILSEFPEVLERVSHEIGIQRERFRVSTETKVDDPKRTIENFNRQLQLSQEESIAVDHGVQLERLEEGDTMFTVVNAYTRAAQVEGLSAESRYRLQKAAGTILGMLQ